MIGLVVSLTPSCCDQPQPKQRVLPGVAVLPFCSNQNQQPRWAAAAQMECDAEVAADNAVRAGGHFQQQCAFTASQEFHENC